MDIEAEVSRYKNCKDRDELVRQIKNYKNLALQYATNLVLAGQYTKVAQRLQEMCDKLPAPQLVKYPPRGQLGVPVKTATISDTEHDKIDAAWRQKAKK